MVAEPENGEMSSVYAIVFAVPATPTLILFCVVSQVRIPVAVETPVAASVLNPN